MTRFAHHLSLLLLATAICGCGDRDVFFRRGDKASSAIGAPPLPTTHLRPLPACFATDSLRNRPLTFGVLDKSDETGDVSGTLFVFGADSVGMSVHVRTAHGELGAARPVSGLQAHTDSVSFWFDNGGKTRYYHRMVLDCTAIVSHAHLFVTVSDTGMAKTDTFPRLLDPPK